MSVSEEYVEKLKNGIFNLETIRFGRIPEIMLCKLYEYKLSGDKAYDLSDNLNQKIEVKFSCVRKKEIEPITPENVLETCLKSADGSEDRKVFSSNLREFDCNIQQIKPSQFDVLYYGLFFSDKIYTFKVDCESIKKNYSIIFLSKKSNYFTNGTIIKSLFDECISKYKSSTPELSEADERYIGRRLGTDKKPNQNNILALLQTAEVEIEALRGIEFPNDNYKILDFSNDIAYIKELKSILQTGTEIEILLSRLSEYYE